MPVIRLRTGEQPRDDDDVLIHMGAGAAASVLNQVLRTYDDYRSITLEGEGLLAVSVFAVVDGVSRTDPQSLATGAVRNGNVRRGAPTLRGAGYQH